MADTKISDLSAISSVDVSDEFPIVDKSDTTQASSGSTKKGTVQNLKDYFDGQYAAIGSVYGPTRIVSESHQFISGMTFKVYNVTWINAGTQYTNNFNENVIISDGDDYYPRKDIVVLDLDDDTLDVVEGEAVAAIAAEPALLPNQLRLFVVDVPTGATSLAGITTVTMYDEAVDEYGGEWDVVGTGTVDTASTDDSSNGLYSIKFPTGTISQFATLSVASPVTVSALAIGFKFKQPSAHNYKFNVILYNTEENTVYPYVTVEGDNYGLDSSSTDWQEVFISFPSITTFDQLRFVNLRNNSLIYFDEVEYQTGLPAAEVIEFLPTGGYTGNAQDIIDLINTNSSGPASDTGTTITFTEDTLYNEASYLTSGALTLDLTGAVKGTYAVVFCDSYEPAISGETYYINSGTFNASALNILSFFYDGTQILLNIGNVTYLSAPTLSASAGNSANTVSWSAITNADSYVIQRDTDSGFPSPTTAYNSTGTSFNDTGLTGGTTYYYRGQTVGNGYLTSDWSSTVNATPLEFSTSLVASYSFEDDLTDYTTNHDGTGTNTPTYVTGKVGNAIDFVAASTQYVTVSDSDDFSFTDGAGNDTSFSVSFWVNPDALSGAQYLVNKRNGSVHEWAILLNGNILEVYMFSGGATSSYIRNLCNIVSYGSGVGAWTHVVITYDATEADTGLDIYFNGVLGGIITRTTVGTYTGMSNTAADVYMARRGGSTNYFSGNLDQLHIWKGRELSAAEVEGLYDIENAGTEIFT